MHDIPWQQLIDEHTEWEERNFPNPNREDSLNNALFGIMEEVGELAHAHLKEKQKIRGDSKLHIAEAKDAIGDATIYLLHVFHRMGIDEEPAWAPYDPDKALLRIGKKLGSLLTQPGYYEAMMFMGALRDYCIARSWSYYGIVTETWNEVKKRDWKENPEDGRVESGSTGQRREDVGGSSRPSNESDGGDEDYNTRAHHGTKSR